MNAATRTKLTKDDGVHGDRRDDDEVNAFDSTSAAAAFLRLTARNLPGASESSAARPRIGSSLD